MDKAVYRVLIAGEGGQGVQAISHILAEAAFVAGLNVSYMPNYGVEQRGGVSLGFLQISKGVIGFPKFSTADIIVVLRDRAIHRVQEYIGDTSLYIYDSDTILGSELRNVAAEKLAVPATSLAKDKLVPQVFNVILMGAIVSEMKILDQKIVETAMDKHFATKYLKKPQLKSLNRKALELGVSLAKEAYSPKKKGKSVFEELGV